MRSIAPSLLLPLLAAGCAHAPATRVSGPEIELALDEGRVAERPLTPPQPFEMLMRFDPHLPAWRAARLRLQLAQPGHIVITLYAVDGNGRPGAAFHTLDRVYGPELTSEGDMHKWIVEELVDVPLQRGAVFVGLHCPVRESDPRLWATSNDTGQVFQRDSDPSLTLDQMKIPRTPRLRLIVIPAQAN